VVGLSLAGLRLTGTISQALTMMPGLRVMILSGNYFSGPLMYAGPDLEVLDLSGGGNNVTVNAVDWLSASRLSYLDLSGNAVVSSWQLAVCMHITCAHAVMTACHDGMCMQLGTQSIISHCP
jgi:hypothetical protein